MKKLILAITILTLVGIALGAWQYYTGPKRTAAEWLACRGWTNRELVTRTDRQFWAESGRDKRDGDLEAFQDACLSTSTIEEVVLHGKSADVQVKTSGPDLTYAQITEFPATATLTDRLALLRERASHAPRSEGRNTLKLRLEGLTWRVSLNLKDSVLLRREEDRAEALEKAGDDAGAIQAYDRLAARPDLSSQQRTRMKERRLDVLAKKACREAAKQYLKYPSAAEFELTGMADLSEHKPVSVMGSVMAPNAFGVEGKFAITCEVTFSTERSSATVKLFMLPENDPTSLISEDKVDVDL